MTRSQPMPGTSCIIVVVAGSDEIDAPFKIGAWPRRIPIRQMALPGEASRQRGGYARMTRPSLSNATCPATRRSPLRNSTRSPACWATISRRSCPGADQDTDYTPRPTDLSGATINV